MYHSENCFCLVLKREKLGKKEAIYGLLKKSPKMTHKEIAEIASAKIAL